MIFRTRPWLLSLRCALAGMSIAGGGRADAATLPIGFAETKIADGLNPTTMSFAPDGRLFLCEKQGVLRVVVDGTMLPTPVLDISKSVDSWNERGFLSICFDPEFARNGWIYVYYTHPRNPGDASHGSSNNRVSRFTLKGNVAAPNSEVVLLEIDNLSKIGWHNGGGLNFGKDGKLYVSTGENANGPNAQDSGNLLGKLMRFNKDGTIPSDNPHYRDFTGNSRAIAAMGLRNPFTIAVQRSTGLMYLSVVGDRYEQIESYNSGAAPVAVNYGWPGIDGPARNQTTPAGYQAPAYAYDHGSGDATALCGGDFYNPAKPGTDAFPPEYTGRFFFSDYRGWIKALDPAKPGTRIDFAGGIDRPIDVDTAPDGSLWYIARAGTPGGSDAANTSSNNGSLWRVKWTGGGQPVKLAVIRQPGSANAGEPLGEVKVALQDASGETVAAATDTVTLSLDGDADGTLGGTLKVAAVKGVATFPALTIGKPGQAYVLRASSGGMKAAASATFDIADHVATPAISPAAGNFSGPVWVQISSSTPEVTIRFTKDGKDPDASSEIYRGPFEMTAGGTIRAVAQRNGLTDSTVAEAKIAIAGSAPYGMDYRLAVSSLKVTADPEGLPASLSGTGIFIDRNLTPRPGIVPYSLNSPAWADGAETRRWVALPAGGEAGFKPTGEFSWPGGAIFIQHFEIVTNQATGARRRIETRLLVLDATGSFGYGATYRWRPDGSDADLVDAGGQEEVLKVSDAAGTAHEQTWSYPARGLCFMCHTPNAGFVLGPKARQLNGDFAYPGGRVDNQLRNWSYLQMFTPAVDESAIKGYEHTVRSDDPKAKLESRVRSYLDGNCAQCHRPGGTGAQWDARFDTPLANQGILGGEVRNNLGIENAKIVTPGDPAKSIMHMRLGSTAPDQQMPPLTRNVVDAKALEMLDEWIRANAGKAGQ